MHTENEEVLENNVQEKSVKMVAGLTSSTNGDRCAELGLETLQSRRDRQDMTLVYRYINRDMQSLFKIAGENCGARLRSAAGSTSIMNQYARTDLEKQSFQ